MAAATLSDPIYHDEDKARAHFEKVRWPEGRTCPHCGVVGDDQSTLLNGKAHRKGLYKCKSCGDQFTATIGTVYEDSKVPLNKWLLAMHLMCASKKGISALQLQRELALGSYRTAWFMAHRIREASEPIRHRVWLPPQHPRRIGLQRHDANRCGDLGTVGKRLTYRRTDEAYV